MQVKKIPPLLSFDYHSIKNNLKIWSELKTMNST